MDNLAAAAFRELKLAGLEVKYFEHVGVIELTIDHIKYYIRQFPEIEEYSAVFVKYEINYDDIMNDYITLHYEDYRECDIRLTQDTVNIHGEIYKQIHDNFNFGHLYNNTFVSYENIWIKQKLYSHVNRLIGISSMSILNNIDDILNSEFMPVIPRQVNIKNEGFKIVRFVAIDNTDINDLTTLSFVSYIIDGVYLKNKNGDKLFRYVNGDGELFALLFDPQSKEMTLASALRVVKVAEGRFHRVKCVDGLYNGYEIKNDISKFTDYYDIGAKKNMPSIYCYNNIFFGFYYDYAVVVELDARRPGSGANTKAAAADL